MSGEGDLQTLLREMQPLLHPEKYVFCNVNEDVFPSLNLHPLATFREQEGITLVLQQRQAEGHSLSYEGVWALITLQVHSSLQAVGFLAKITAALAQAGVSVNVFSAYYHDHLLIPWEKRLQALNILKGIWQSNKLIDR